MRVEHNLLHLVDISAIEVGGLDMVNFSLLTQMFATVLVIINTRARSKSVLSVEVIYFSV